MCLSNSYNILFQLMLSIQHELKCHSERNFPCRRSTQSTPLPTSPDPFSSSDPAAGADADPSSAPPAPRCTRVFVTAKERDRHELHCGTVYKCDQCDASYAAREALLTHCQRTLHRLPAQYHFYQKYL